MVDFRNEDPTSALHTDEKPWETRDREMRERAATPASGQAADWLMMSDLVSLELSRREGPRMTEGGPVQPNIPSSIQPPDLLLLAAAGCIEDRIRRYSEFQALTTQQQRQLRAGVADGVHVAAALLYLGSTRSTKGNVEAEMVKKVARELLALVRKARGEHGEALMSEVEAAAIEVGLTP